MTYSTLLLMVADVNVNSDHAEIYPECLIAFWDALGLLLDAENIEQSVHLNAEKIRMFM